MDLALGAEPSLPVWHIPGGPGDPYPQELHDLFDALRSLEAKLPFSVSQADLFEAINAAAESVTGFRPPYITRRHGNDVIHHGAVFHPDIETLLDGEPARVVPVFKIEASESLWAKMRAENPEIRPEDRFAYLSTNVYREAITRNGIVYYDRADGYHSSLAHAKWLKKCADAGLAFEIKGAGPDLVLLTEILRAADDNPVFVFDRGQGRRVAWIGEFRFRPVCNPMKVAI
jgi:hypothetical protein